jgi:hypothetical protein
VEDLHIVVWRDGSEGTSELVSFRPILLKNSKSQARHNSVGYRGNQKFRQASPYRPLRTSYIATSTL